MLNPEFKKKWIDALRSGEYQQTRYSLHRVSLGKDSYCCLGVACAISNIDCNKAGAAYRCLREEGLIDDTIQDELIPMNDVDGLSFPEIADYIEANL